MKPYVVLARERTPAGAELTLWQRGGDFDIRVGGEVLMSSRQHGSEEALARLGCGHLARAAGARVLVGGLGMGYTLRAALGVLPADASVVVAEIFPAVVAWNRGPLADLAGRPLEDRRVAVEARDVAVVLREAPGGFDAILLDVDNGPDGLATAANDSLYGPAGLAACRRALRPGGALAVWSAAPDAGFARRLGRAGLAAAVHAVPARPGSGARHTVFVGRGA